jgi:multidrug efflux pump subunit AcrA (membrane-fusion protein)
MSVSATVSQLQKAARWVYLCQTPGAGLSSRECRAPNGFGTRNRRGRKAAQVKGVRGGKDLVSARRRLVIGALTPILLGSAAATYRFQGALIPWIEGKSDSDAIEVSGNIEAHESILSFKTVQSRIVDLPFDEGQRVTASTVLARVDDSDYRQQVAIAEAALTAQMRQLDVAEQSVDATRRTVVSDEADVALKQLEFDRAQTLLTRGAGTVDARDVADTALKQSRAALDRDKALRRGPTRASPSVSRTSAAPERRSISPRSSSATRR